MRKAIIVFFLAFTSLISFAQHFQFMGIPIDGTLDEFEQRIKEKGFEAVDNGELATIFEAFRNQFDQRWYLGVYAGYQTNVLVSSTPHSNLVYSVLVVKLFKDYESAKRMVDFIKKVIAEKYTIDKVSNESDERTTFEVGLGDIVVQISNISDNPIFNNNYSVMIMYFDIKNTTLRNDEARSDI